MVLRRFFVPLLSYSEYYKSLNAALDLGRDIKHSIDNLKSENRLSEQIRTTSSASLEAFAKISLGTVPNEDNYKSMIRSVDIVSQRRQDMDVSASEDSSL